MIVKNEEKVLSRCLFSICDAVDEIVIVDTGSTDKTIEIAKKFTNKVYKFSWCDDFSAARNFAFSKATGDYLMWLDADDVVPKNTKNFIKNHKKTLNFDTFMLKYDILFENNKSIFSYYRERIVKNCDKAKFVGFVHECIVPFGKIKKLNYSIEHRKEKTKHSDRNLKIYEKQKQTKKFSAREQYYYSRELFDHQKYDECIYELNKFVKMKNVFKENLIDAHYILALCYFQKNKHEKAYSSLVNTFKFDLPRANICYLLGKYFMQQGDYKNAIYWFKTETKCKSNIKNGGFCDERFFNYFPYLEMCVCYFKLNDIKKANFYNEKAGKFFNSTEVINNRNFFNKRINL